MAVFTDHLQQRSTRDVIPPVSRLIRLIEEHGGSSARTSQSGQRCIAFIVGLIEGTADALSSILKLVAGSISDRLPRRKSLVVGGYALATASRAWIAIAGRWTSVLAARLVDRTGKGIRSAPRDARATGNVTRGTTTLISGTADFAAMGNFTDCSMQFSR